MVVLNVTANNCAPQTIVIGRRGTYDTLQIAFDLSYLVESYGNGVAVLAVKRSQDESAYPEVVTQEDNTLTWTVSETDTYYVGAGEAQLMWYVDGGLAKTIIYPMVVMRDILMTSEEAPDAYQTWVDALIAKGAETLQNAQDAAQSASDAEQAKDDAVAAKEAAEDAKEAAENAATHYPKIGNNYWMVWDVASHSYVNTGIQAEGEDGYSPEISITTITGGHRVTITDKNNPQGQSFDVMDGTDGYSPVVTVTTITGGHRVTITDEEHPQGQSFDVMDGVDGASDAGEVTYDPTETYQSGTAGAALNVLNRHKQDAPATAGTAGQVLGLDSQLNPVWIENGGSGGGSSAWELCSHSAWTMEEGGTEKGNVVLNMTSCYIDEYEFMIAGYAKSSSSAARQITFLTFNQTEAVNPYVWGKTAPLVSAIYNFFATFATDNAILHGETGIAAGWGNFLTNNISLYTPTISMNYTKKPELDGVHLLRDYINMQLANMIEYDIYLYRRSK